MKRIIPTVIVGAALLVACGNGPERGTVTDTWHDPQEVEVVTACHLVGKVNVCGPTTRIDPEEWKLLLEGQDDKGKGDKGKGDKGWRSVSEGVYDLCPADTHYPECAETLKAVAVS